MAIIFAECEGKSDRSHKGRALAWAKFSFDHQTAVVTYVTYVRTYIYVIHASACTCAPEMRSVRTARGCGEEGGPPLPFESIIAVLVAEREIYQWVGVYVATNCRVNIHAIRGWPSPLFVFPPAFRILVPSTRRRRREILDFDPDHPLLSSLKPVAST